MKKRNEEKIFTMVCLALLTAVQVVLARFAVVPLSTSMRISVSFIPVVIAARRFGVPGSVAVYALGDLVGAVAFPTTGAYFPGYTLTAAVSGLIFGLFLSKKSSPMRIVLSVVCSQLLCTVLMNSFWISVQYGSEFSALVATRLVQALVVGTVQIVFMLIFLEKICKVIRIPNR